MFNPFHSQATRTLPGRDVPLGRPRPAAPDGPEPHVFNVPAHLHAGPMSPNRSFHPKLGRGRRAAPSPTSHKTIISAQRVENIASHALSRIHRTVQVTLEIQGGVFPAEVCIAFA